MQNQRIAFSNKKSISEIFDYEKLNIPQYQRPYKWERHRIKNLFYDIREAINLNKDEYRIGTIIFHNNKQHMDIVDGQQRLISISLFLLLTNKRELPKGATSILEHKYIEVSQSHAKENYEEWEFLYNLISKEEQKLFYNYILEKCTVSMIEMPEDSLSEAFQLFDSQNNRGKALAPHDLLKAYHLRAIDNPDAEIIKNWEDYIDNKDFRLEDLFDKHLFRIRKWTKGETGLYKKKYGSELKFTNRYIEDFKGVTLKTYKTKSSYPYLKLYEELQQNEIEYPYSLLMPIINGKDFFKYIDNAYQHFQKYYYNEKKLYNILENNNENDIKIILDSHKNTYSRNINLYINIIAIFIDRFGENQVNGELIEKLFLWAFYPRISAKAIYDSTMANYAAGGKFRYNTCQKLFQELGNSPTPQKFVSSINTDNLENITVKLMLEKLQNKY